MGCAAAVKLQITFTVQSVQQGKAHLTFNLTHKTVAGYFAADVCFPKMLQVCSPQAEGRVQMILERGQHSLSD